jgi:hypothetical protein
MKMMIIGALALVACGGSSPAAIPPDCTPSYASDFGSPYTCPASLMGYVCPVADLPNVGSSGSPYMDCQFGATLDDGKQAFICCP